MINVWYSKIQHIDSDLYESLLCTLPEEQQKVFLLRHNFQLNYDQIAAVLNQTPENVMAWLFRARVQIVKCLGRG